MLDLARAKRDVFLAQKELADCVIRENEVFASLLRVRAAAAEKMIDQTDIGLGCMRVVFRDHGWSHIPLSRPSQEQGPSSLRGTCVLSLAILLVLMLHAWKVYTGDVLE